MLHGKTALVTGSTSGIGLGVAQALAKEGANIIINGLGNADEIEKIRASIEADYKVKALYHGADMTRPDQIRDMCAKGIEAFGAIDILVNNAGIQFVAPIDEFPEEKWDAIIAINLTSAFHTTKACLPGMKKKGWGRIINIASAHGLVASPFKSAYVSAKHGIVGMTKTIALEVATEYITCNAICPGYVNTPLVQNQIRDQAKVHGISETEVVEKIMMQPQPTKKFVEIDQIGEVSVFLCSDAAQNITGIALPIDGGWTAR
ncbi:MAG: 3-hydroxybutyrate dehydrogenase [Micavibrio aeruginosavorus]|nr:3-hydroxybutyrate dehydrogenase [Micavibrio aeruginosavorus]